ncbi:hypothetical protein [Hyphococcus luteus]|uniref:Uncharacterized protein n=1 Tax=Hyphococcus luteus TaxID=2058213 RepID=A0A2S7K7G1_9PROT|nr:hypothetical protein [Marinicaulis flavus]PQA88454.1 hypothetical protein CW354_09195 [Marinicaulis flavus]
MIKQALAAGAAAFITITSAYAGMPLNQWTGAYEKNTDGLHSLSITNNGGALEISVKGECTPNPCDWGSAPAVAFADSAGGDPASNTEAITAVYNQSFATKTIVLDGRAGNTLRAHIYTHFTDNSGRSDYVAHVSLKKKMLIARPLPGGPIIARPLKPFKEDCISFNPDAVSVAKKNGSWKLVQGSMWMLDAGSKKSEMNRAKTIVQHYGMNKQCFVGRPDASLEYWLAGNAAPSGGLAGEDCVSINPNGLSVKNSGGHFTIVSNGNHYAFTAPSQEEAETVIKAIKYYGFTKSCFVGRPDPSMRYLRK